MGLFTNPLGHAGYPPNVTGTPYTQPSAVRAATLAEVEAGVIDYAYVSPATFSGGSTADFASPPPIGSGVPNTGRFTTLTSTLNSNLSATSSATQVGIGTAANTAALTTNINTGNGAAASTVNVLTGTPSAGAQTLNLLSSTGLLGFFGTTAAVQQDVAALTNSVTAGGTTGTIANFTSLSVYATDAPTIRNDIYQLALQLNNIQAALAAYGLL